jgi:hypothetical protein
LWISGVVLLDYDRGQDVVPGHSQLWGLSVGIAGCRLGSMKIGGSDGGAIGGVTVGQRQVLRSHRFDRFVRGQLMRLCYVGVAG